MATSAKKIMSNRANAKKSTGPKDTSSTRINALRHGLCAAGLTDLDDVQRYRATLSDLMREQVPVGSLETFLVETLAFEMVILLRARRLQAEYIESVLHLPRREKDVIGDVIDDLEGKILDSGLPAALSPMAVEHVVNLHERYATGSSNRFLRTLNTFEREQRIRQGEHVPAPVAVVASVAETVTRESVPAEPQQPSPVQIEERETAAAPAIADITDVATGALDLPSADSEDERVLPADEENLAARTPPDIADGESGKVDSAPVPWNPKAPSGAIWNRR